MTDKKLEEKKLTDEQQMVIDSKRKNLVVSASAGSGKTFVVVEKLIKLICEEKVPLSRLLVLTFTKAAANELKSRLFNEILNQPSSPFLIEQLDEVMVSDISTIDAFCEKVIKRNINKLSLPQNFVILDEKASKKLKNTAFKRAFEYFSSQKSEVFDEIYFAFKRNEDGLYECVNNIQSFFDSLSNSDEMVEKFSSNLALFHEKACQRLKENFEKAFKNTSKMLNEALLEANMIGEKLASGHIKFVEALESFVDVDFSKDLFTLCKEIASKTMPAISSSKSAVKAKFAKAKEEAKAVYDTAKEIYLATDEMIESAKNGVLSGKLMQFYSYYANQYKLLKEKRWALDFADLEKYAQLLIQDDEVKRSLQERYDYIIIDEYQDTNRLQESILKPIAEGGFFIAVGDIKQGIYGFRNASKEIMSEDIEKFSTSEDGEALFLRGNFRTDARILTFVNSIFEKLMTISSVGIDYKKTSVLEGLSKFQPNNLPAVCVDVVFHPKAEKSKKEDEDKNAIWEEIYSVQEDELGENYKYKDEILTIAHRIEQALESQIYLPKQKIFRKVEMGDIALLFRGRSKLMEECVAFLQEKGFSVNADIKENLIEDGAVALLVSLLKIAINPNDDIPLASVMNSPFGDFTLQELGDIRKLNSDGYFYEIVNNLSKSEEKTPLNIKINAFFENINKFKFDLDVFGIVKAFEKIFNKTSFMEYIAGMDDGGLKRIHINKLFAFIRSANLDRNPQEVVSQLENSDKDEKAISDGGNAITVTTIHATKGLEYPIVIICGGGENLNKVYNKQFIANKEFGLGTFLYDYQKNLRLPSPVFLAGKDALKERERVDELMLFYVAMTRPQNHLYIIGSLSENDLKALDKQNTYLKQILFALGENFVANLFESGQIVTQNVVFNVITEVVEQEEQNFEKQLKIEEISSKFAQEIEKYNNFEYKNKHLCKFSYKNSVTGAMKLVENEYGIGEVLFSEHDSEKEIIESQQQKEAREKAVEEGNSYHEALKLIDFEKVCDLNSLEIELNSIKSFMTEGYFENIDLDLLYKNIFILKMLTKNSKTFKEREFIMESTPQEITNGGEKGESIIVQGIIDLFAVGEKIVLVDYKYTSLKDEEKLINRYGGQIRLYAIALEKAFEGKDIEKYLLSLKEGKLIKIQ